MPSKRGKDGGSPVKTSTSATTKRVRRDEATKTHDASVTAPTARTEVESSTGHDVSPDAFNAEDNPELMVDFNESIILPAPIDDGDSERVWHGMDLLTP